MVCIPTKELHKSDHKNMLLRKSKCLSILIITASESPYSSYVHIKNTAGYHASANVHNLSKQANLLHNWHMIYFQPVSENNTNFVKYDLLQSINWFVFGARCSGVEYHYLVLIIDFTKCFISSWWLLLLLAYLMFMAIPLQQRLLQTICLRLCNYLHPGMFAFRASFRILYWSCSYRNTLCQIYQNQCWLGYFTDAYLRRLTSLS